MKSTDVVFLLPAYNPGDDALAITLDSLRRQTQRAHIVIVDDGSRTPLTERLPAEPGLTILRMPQNGGITRALNHGLEHILAAGYTYIARMDCGDTCTLDRIEKQYSFMEQHPEIELVGCASAVVSPAGDQLYIHGHGDAASLSRQLGNNSPMLHPTFFFRRSLIERIGPYSEDYPAAEDYELLLRANNGRNLACLEDVLVSCVADPNGITLSNWNRQLGTRLKLQMRYFRTGEPSSYYGIARSLAIGVIPQRIWLPLKRFIRSFA